jgi:RNA polymerase sigma-70 factor (ECF subfamily)
MDTDLLLDRIAQGEPAAADALLEHYRNRLRTMVRLRLDNRLASRVDPSDVVQDALVEAHRRLPAYAAERPIPFYPWLRRIAWDRLMQMHRQHIGAKRRTVLREDAPPLADESELLLAERLAVSSSPSAQAVQREVSQRVRAAVAMLAAADREVIVLKHLEELSFQDIAAVMETTVAAVYSRYYRAIARLHGLLNEGSSHDA